MRKINLQDYSVEVVGPDGNKRTIPYNVKDSLVSLLFIKELKLNAAQLLKQNILANKILGAGDEIVLEEEEYERVLAAVNKLEGFSKNDVELVSRVVEAQSFNATIS